MQKKTFPFKLLMPISLICVLTIFLPITISFIYSLQRYKLTEPHKQKFIGLDNYYNILTSSDFYNALYNSMMVIILVVVFGIALSVIIALVLNQKTVITPLLTGILIAPIALPPIVNGIMWKFIFYPSYGLLNRLLLQLNLVDTPIAWITNRHLFLCVIAIVILWRVVPFAAIILLANLQSIPKAYYESIYLEGSTKMQAFRYITLPLILPSISIVLLNFTTASINVFDEVIALAGYQFENQTLMLYNYSNTFSFLNFGLGSAISYVIMLLCAILGYIYINHLNFR